MPSERTLAILAKAEFLGPEGYHPFWDTLDFRYYDREGEPITQRQCMTLRGLFEEYGRLALDRVGPAEVSTVWMGLDHQFVYGGPPLIFETMVFGAGGELDNIQYRYSTEQEALEGHRKIVEELRLLHEATS